MDYAKSLLFRQLNFKLLALFCQVDNFLNRNYLVININVTTDKVISAINEEVFVDSDFVEVAGVKEFVEVSWFCLKVGIDFKNVSEGRVVGSVFEITFENLILTYVQYHVFWFIVLYLQFNLILSRIQRSLARGLSLIICKNSEYESVSWFKRNESSWNEKFWVIHM